MRRRNFSWDSRSKAALIISLFTQEESDAKDIARQIGFDTHTELANYMKNKGYHWDSRQGNYIKIPEDEVQAVQLEESPAQISTDTSVTELMENIIPLLRKLQKPEQIIALADETLCLPRYQLKGMYGTKAVRMANILDVLVRDYSIERNICQREIFEIALIEFFKKYGYRDKIVNYLFD